jgi:hypothetical protein
MQIVTRKIYKWPHAGVRDILKGSETEQSSVEVTPTCSGVKVGGIAGLPDPAIRKVDWVCSETALVPGFQMRGLETISTARCDERGPDFS